VAPESTSTDIDDAENPYMDLADATAEDIANHSTGEEDDSDSDDGAPMGFRILKGSYFPHLKGHIVEMGVDSSSEYAKRVFYKDGCPVDEPYMTGSNESDSDDSDDDDGKLSVQKKKRGVEEVEEQDDKLPAKVSRIVCRTRCGMVSGEGWDGNAQCTCFICMGEFDSQESEQSHSQEGAAAEA
jgi:hypothetical protein